MVVLINPNLVVQRNDPFTTGIVYMPINLAYIASSLLKANIPLKVIDAFAEQPYQARHNNKFLILGLSCTEIVARIPADAKVVFVYAVNLTNHLSTIDIVQAVKQGRRDLRMVVVENPHAVTAYSLQHVANEFYDAGADYILTGDGERRAVRIAQALMNNFSEDDLLKLDGVGSREFYNIPVDETNDLDGLPFPAWDLFPLENYWSLRFAHGPQTTKRYLPLLTSRGCPYQCKFCVAPANSNQKWRLRSATNVVDEIEYSINKYQVCEFHIEDINPTVSDRRIRGICDEILKRRLIVIWKIAAGTKVETIKNEETINLMAKAGCRYISVSPETGSPRLLELMNKPFDLNHAVRLIKRMNQVGICSQACFVLGFHGETNNDLRMTWNLVRELARVGVDEIALFIITPVPGSSIFNEFYGYKNLSELNFSPTWRADYHMLSNFRLRLYMNFLFWKLCSHPLKILRQLFNFIKHSFDTKTEMVVYRAFVYKWLDKKAVD